MLNSRVLGSAFGWSFFTTFVSRRSLELRSAPPVNPVCAALRDGYTKPAPCSLPRPSAPLRGLTAPLFAHPSPTVKRMFFYWPAKAKCFTTKVPYRSEGYEKRCSTCSFYPELRTNPYD